MLRIRDIAMGPEQDVTSLLFEAAKILISTYRKEKNEEAKCR